MFCPNCKKEQQAGATECPYCQIVFSKFSDQQALRDFRQSASQSSASSMQKPSTIKVGSIIAGFIVTFLVCLVLYVIIGITFVPKLGIDPKMSPEQINKVLLGSNSYQYANLALFLFSSFFIGYFTASKAKQAEVKHGLVVGIIAFILSLISIPFMDLTQSGIAKWVFYVDLITTIPLSTFGGYLVS